MPVVIPSYSRGATMAMQALIIGTASQRLFMAGARQISGLQGPHADGIRLSRKFMESPSLDVPRRGWMSISGG